MKAICLYVALFLLIACVVCDKRYRGNAINPEYPGQCYYAELQQPIPKEQSFKPINRDGPCESFFCRSDFVLEIEYCGRHSLFPNETCELDSDMRRAYPECCPKLVCQTDKNFI